MAFVPRQRLKKIPIEGKAADISASGYSRRVHPEALIKAAVASGGGSKGVGFEGIARRAKKMPEKPTAL